MPEERPHTTRRGLAVLAFGAVFLGAGFVADQVVVVLWGALAVVVVALDRLAVMVRATLFHPPRATPAATAGLRLSWDPEDPPSGFLGEPLPLRLRFALRPGLSCRGVSFRPVGSAALTLLPDAAQASAAADGRAAFSVVAAHVGAWFVHGVVVAATSPLGFHRVAVYRPLERRLRAWPRPVAARLARPFAATRASVQEGVDRAFRPQRGMSSELRELRDHAPGDPFKHIAWKATARTGRLIVKEFDPEFTLSAYVALDLSPPMRAGPPGATPLDRAVDVAWTLVTQLARNRDRVGYVAFDARVLAFRRAAAGRKAEAGISEELLGVHQRVDEDLTAVTDGELVARVASYLQRQRGLDLGARGRRAAGTRLPDRAVLLDRVAAVDGEAPPQNGADGVSELARDPDAARLRAFCREHGVELPYRPTCSPSDRARGILAAFERIVQAGGGPHVLVVLTELGAVASADALVRAVRLARGHRNRVVVIMPRAATPPATRGGPAPPSPPPATTGLREALAEVYAEDDEQRRAEAAAILRSAGATVLALDDTARLPTLLRHLQRAVR